MAVSGDQFDFLTKHDGLKRGAETEPTNCFDDEVLEALKSKGAFVVLASARERIVKSFYPDLGEGLLMCVGPVVQALPIQKPISTALREINPSLVTETPVDRTTAQILVS